ncbi:MAG: HAD-IC family P-type ATPase, partial [Gemmatimonadota bacterium]
MLDAEALRETPWHARAADEAVESLQTDPERGLSPGAAQERLERYGRNRIRTVEETPWWRILLHQVADPLIYILLAAAAVSLLIQAYTDAAVILAVVVLNGAIGFTQEWRARKAIRALAEMSAPDARVVREGGEREIDAEEVVPGDIVVLGSGDRVPADARLLVAEDLRVDESALTGEAEPVSKREEPVEDEHAVPGDRFSMVFAGANVTRGRARGVVVRTGDASELGRIAEVSQEVAGVEAPIQERVRSLAHWIAAAVLVLTVLVVLAGLLVDLPLADAVRTAVALAVAAVPEGLPIVLTVTLAVGVQRMARRNAIIRALPAVETLGSTTVVGADKTGTLTANRMTTRVIWTGGGRYEVTGTGWETEGEIRPADPDRAERRGERAADGVASGGLEGGAPAVDEAVRLTLLA